jgi:hypothetical protein
MLLRVEDSRPLEFDASDINGRAPVYVVTPRHKTDPEIRMISRIKKARLQFRSFDPEEQGRLSAIDAISNVAQSHGIVVPLLSANRDEAEVHNMRAAFIAGLAHGMEKEILILQSGEDPVPIDYRDLVSSFKFPSQIDEHIATFAEEMAARFQAGAPIIVPEPRNFLARLKLGASSAENELSELGNYFLETDEFQRAVRGEVLVASGRKGAGKTALFVQVRNKIRPDRKVVVLDLKPEGFQLLRFKEVVLGLLEEGTKEHTITAFWEYLLFLEICHKILENDKDLHLYDHRIYEQYQTLAQVYREDEYVTEGDFSERMLKLTQRIAQDFQAKPRTIDKKIRLNQAEMTELLYKHDMSRLTQHVIDYLKFKKSIWILFDNLDKGWPPHGIKPDDVVMLRCLIEALGKLRRILNRAEIECYATVFIRNDVFELLVENMPDRGKISRIMLDWADPDLLREVIRKRLLFNNIKGEVAPISWTDG